MPCLQGNPKKITDPKNLIFTPNNPSIGLPSSLLLTLSQFTETTTINVVNAC